MKRFLALILSLIFILTVAGCGAGGQAPAPSSSEESSVPESPSSGEEPEPDPEPLPELRPGRIVGFWDAQQDAVPTRDVKGTQAELDRWKAAVRDPAISRLDFNNMHQESMELPVEQELEILTAMRDAEVRLYEGNPNPSTGGGCWVDAYDGEENFLFHITYLGDFFTVRFPGEEVSYYFDGEGTTLDDLLHSDYGIPMEAPDENSERAPDPGVYDPDPGPDQSTVDRVEAMLAYLEENLDPWNYSEVWRGGDGSWIEILTPFPDAVKPVVEAYTGEAVPVEYHNEEFSKGQLEQAKTDLEQFLKDHPEVKLWDWRPILLFGGYKIELKEPSDALTKFIESYSIPGIYKAGVYSDEQPLHPD